MFYCRGMRGSVREDEWQIEEECSHWNCAFCQAVRWTVSVCLLPDCVLWVTWLCIHHSSVCSRHSFTLSRQELLIHVHLLTHLASTWWGLLWFLSKYIDLLLLPVKLSVAAGCSFLKVRICCFPFISFIIRKVASGSGKLCWAFWDFFVDSSEIKRSIGKISSRLVNNDNNPSLQPHLEQQKEASTYLLAFCLSMIFNFSLLFFDLSAFIQ